MVLEYCLSHNYFWYGGDFYTQKRGVVMGAKFVPSLANLFMSEWMVFRQDNKLVTKVYFKSSDRNSYLSIH